MQATRIKTGSCCSRAIVACRNSFSRRRSIAARTAAAAAKRYVVVGAGFAGLATAYHLLRQSEAGHPVHVTVVDAVGIGAGGSGAAAGLLHPFTSKGKLLWRAEEAIAAALQLLQVAEAAAAATPGLPSQIAWRTGMLRPAASIKQSQGYWKLYHHQHCEQQQKQQQQQQQQQRLGDASNATTAALAAIGKPSLPFPVAAVSYNTAQQLVPGVALPAAATAAASACSNHAHPQQHRQCRQQQQQQSKLEGWSLDKAAALHIPAGVTLHPQHYMEALWAACELAAADRSDGSSAALHIQQLTSLQQLCNLKSGSSSSSSYASAPQQQQQQQQQFDAIVVAAGAAVGSLAEVGPDALQLGLCQGYTLDLVPPSTDTSQQALESSSSSSEVSSSSVNVVGCSSSSSSHMQDEASGISPVSIYPAAAPSLLGTPYLASQGGQLLVVGATKQYNWTTQQSLAELGRKIDPQILCNHQGRPQQPEAAEAAEVCAAASELLAGAAVVWPSVTGWRVGGVRSGVRALPPRTHQGSLPIAGRWTAHEGEQQQQQQQEKGGGAAAGSAAAGSRLPPVWLLVGLGARGLVYHAWLGQLMAAAVIQDNEGLLPAELRAWQQNDN